MIGKGKKRIQITLSKDSIEFIKTKRIKKGQTISNYFEEIVEAEKDCFGTWLEYEVKDVNKND